MPSLRGEDGKYRPNDELTPIQLKMIVEIIENGGNKTVACKKLEVPRSTLYEWFDNELFVNEYRKQCERIYKMSLGKAVSKLTNMMDSKDGRTAIKAVENVLKLNSYLDTKLDVTQKTSGEIVITLVDNTDEV